MCLSVYGSQSQTPFGPPANLFPSSGHTGFFKSSPEHIGSHPTPYLRTFPMLCSAPVTSSPACLADFPLDVTQNVSSHSPPLTAPFTHPLHANFPLNGFSSLNFSEIAPKYMFEYLGVFAPISLSI